MRLFEEYFQRHQLTIPCVYHCTQGAMLFRTEPKVWEKQWLIFYIEWQGDNTHPGTYFLNFLHPVHNGYAKSKLFERLRPVEKEWDEYENWVTNWCRSIQAAQPIRRKTKRGWELILSLWEIFIYCFDGWFCQQPSSIKEILFKSIDAELSVKQRYEHYQKIEHYFTTNYPNLLKLWKTDFLIYYHHYSDWLINLLRE